MRASTFRRQPFFVKLRLALSCALGVALVPLALQWLLFLRTPRVWAARDVPVAFWAWRTQAPTDTEVASAARETGAKTLFLRAGQLHDDNGTLKRVRAVAGSLPRGIELHLVYNSTPTVLAGFERLDAIKLAVVIAETYAQDSARALQEGARVVGLQLDIDAPTRLLAQYARMLRAVRERVPAGTRLSVTGLPTWMESAALKDLLAAVDFWIPQCYGAEIPQRLEQSIAISGPQAVARAVKRARDFDKPFYAGLSAYGYALLYDSRGALISLRGDINPARIATNTNLQLIERKPFDASAPNDVAATRQEITSEWRYVYRARADGVIDGLIVHAGDSLVLNVPSAAALRESARAVRKLAGEKLLGICIFRLPGADDAATLPLEQIAAALLDASLASAIDLRAQAGASLHKEQASSASVRLMAVNSGKTSALFGEDGLVIDIRVPVGSVRAVRPDGFSAIETLCESKGRRIGDEQYALQPCAERRASVIRFRSSDWTAGARASALVSFTVTAPQQLTARVRMQRDDGLTWQQEVQIPTGNGDER